MRLLLFISAFAALSAGLSGCAALTGKDEATMDFDKDTSASDESVREDRARSSLRALESAISDYVKAENRIPEKIEILVPKYLAAVPPLDVPACGRETDKIQNYPSNVLRDGQVDGALLRGTGRWGYVYDSNRVVVFVDCLKPSSKGIPWYQERGVN
ncbi:MAG: hypothetical protein KGL74_12225 [Elusimicrobia bacterium]|nr:hypothetical protein [Elusimicrobiota bacterium]